MSTAEKLARWVEKKPILLVRFDGERSETLELREQESRLEQLTFANPHAAFESVKTPTVCILEIQSQKEPQCYLATVTGKAAVSTFDSRLTVKKLRRMQPSSFQALQMSITSPRMNRLFSERLPDQGDEKVLSSKLSAHVIEVLASDPSNNAALETILSQLPSVKQVSHNAWSQEDAIRMAVNIFRPNHKDSPSQIVLTQGGSSALELIGAHLREDNVVQHDALSFPEFNLIQKDVTGRAIFEKGDEQLVIYTANKLPLEEMFGVDLIYINETQGNIVMVQYKMLSEAKPSKNHFDWIYRPDAQLRKEIDRMQLPEFSEQSSDYRLSRNPFFFKFVKRKLVGDTNQSFLVSLDHLNQILTDPTAKGPRGGVRVGYQSLGGCYLRETEFLGLVRSGYIGTHRAESRKLTPFIEQAAGANRAVVLALQAKLREGAW